MTRQRCHHRCHGAAEVFDDPVNRRHALALGYLLGALALEKFPALQLAGAQHMKRARHLTHFVVALDRRQGCIDVAGGEQPHGVAD
jgi:hypothetical protein